jgi:leucyl aminopeptidase (aminopeptidase T)
MTAQDATDIALDIAYRTHVGCTGGRDQLGAAGMPEDQVLIGSDQREAMLSYGSE